jgi:hypothetical protein
LILRGAFDPILQGQRLAPSKYQDLHELIQEQIKLYILGKDEEMGKGVIGTL